MKIQQKIYLDETVIALLDHLYELRKIDNNRTPKGDLIAEAIVLLADLEIEGPPPALLKPQDVDYD